MFQFTPASVIITWVDKHGTHNGNLAAFQSTADVASTTSITTVGMGLTSISGLSTLPSLLDLNIQANSVSVLNLSGCSKLTNLEIGANPISTIDFSPCPLLASIDCNTLQVTTLNVSSLTLLNNLVCDNTITLTSLNVASNVLLNNLDCSACALNVPQINAILVALDANGQINGTALMQGQTPPAPPTGAWAAAYLNLTNNKGWIIFTD